MPLCKVCRWFKSHFVQAATAPLPCTLNTNLYLGKAETCLVLDTPAGTESISDLYSTFHFDLTWPILSTVMSCSGNTDQTAGAQQQPLAMTTLSTLYLHLFQHFRNQFWSQSCKESVGGSTFLFHRQQKHKLDAKIYQEYFCLELP